MSTETAVSMPTMPHIAPLRNVSAFAALLDRVTKRSQGLPGMAAFYGASGLGKSASATYGANKHKAYYVSVKSAWTKKHLCQSIVREMGLRPSPTVSETVDQIAEQLAVSGRPLIIDEADFLVQKGPSSLTKTQSTSSQSSSQRV